MRTVKVGGIITLFVSTETDDGRWEGEMGVTTDGGKPGVVGGMVGHRRRLPILLILHLFVVTFASFGPVVVCSKYCTVHPCLSIKTTKTCAEVENGTGKKFDRLNHYPVNPLHYIPPLPRPPVNLT